MSADSIQFKLRLTASMILDFIGCWVIENVCKYLFADLEPKSIVTRGRERRERRRAVEESLTQDSQGDNEKKTQ
jgi:cation-transporting ATPase 13A1